MFRGYPGTREIPAGSKVKSLSDNTKIVLFVAVFASHSELSKFTPSSAQAVLSLLNGFILTTTYKGLIVVVSQNINEYLGYTEVYLLLWVKIFILNKYFFYKFFHALHVSIDSFIFDRFLFYLDLCTKHEITSSPPGFDVIMF